MYDNSWTLPLFCLQSFGLDPVADVTHRPPLLSTPKWRFDPESVSKLKGRCKRQKRFLQHTTTACGESTGDTLSAFSKLMKAQSLYVQGKRIGVISSIASNPNNDEEVNAKFAQAIADLQSAGELHDQSRCMCESISTLFSAL